MRVKSPYLTVNSPLITEKFSFLSQQNKYIFRVALEANKIEIKRAIEKIYGVKVTDVNVMVLKGKAKRLRIGQEGKTSKWKKAIVTLKKGDTIKLA